MATLTKPIIRYLGERQRRGEIAQITVRTIRNHLFHFGVVHGNRPLTQLSPTTVERWIEVMTADGLAPGTQAARLSSLRTFARWCVTHGVTKTDWTLNAPKVRRPRRAPRDMVNAHVDLILAEARDPRERLLCWLMFGGGLRCVEVSRLNCDDYDPTTHLLFVTGKGGHQRQVPLPPVVVAAMRSYLASAGHSSGPMVRVHEGARRLGAERISEIVGRLVRVSGVKVRAYDGRSAHGLRAAAASDLFDACGNPLIVQAFLGHANLQTTSIYLRRAGTDKVRDAQLLRPLAC